MTLKETHNSLGSKLIHEWDFISYLASPHVRLYYLPTPDNGGFDFYSIAFSNRKETTLDSKIDTIFHGYAAFDGVRHLHFGEDNYFNYPDVEILAILMADLNNLQKKYCSDFA